VPFRSRSGGSSEAIAARVVSTIKFRRVESPHKHQWLRARSPTVQMLPSKERASRFRGDTTKGKVGRTLHMWRCDPVEGKARVDESKDTTIYAERHGSRKGRYDRADGRRDSRGVEGRIAISWGGKSVKCRSRADQSIIEAKLRWRHWFIRYSSRSLARNSALFKQ